MYGSNASDGVDGSSEAHSASGEVDAVGGGVSGTKVVVLLGVLLGGDGATELLSKDGASVGMLTFVGGDDGAKLGLELGLTLDVMLSPVASTGGDVGDSATGVQSPQVSGHASKSLGSVQFVKLHTDGSRPGHAGSATQLASPWVTHVQLPHATWHIPPRSPPVQFVGTGGHPGGSGTEHDGMACALTTSTLHHSE